MVFLEGLARSIQEVSNSFGDVWVVVGDLAILITLIIFVIVFFAVQYYLIRGYMFLFETIAKIPIIKQLFKMVEQDLEARFKLTKSKKEDFLDEEV